MTFKIYVPVLNEERLINKNITALLKVFDAETVEVIDLGCTDSTLKQIDGLVKIDHNPLPSVEAGKYFTALKNEYSARQPWVLWVDGDEIYPESTLLRIKEIVKTDTKIFGHRLYCRILKEQSGKLFQSNEFLSMGPKLFNSNYLRFVSDWPEETLEGTITPGTKAEFNGLWFWHGVLLTRSTVEEEAVRKAKRKIKEQHYRILTWSECDFKDEPITNWKVLNMSKKLGYGYSWSGTL